MQQKVYFPNSRGDQLCGILSSSVDHVDTPLVILCHGLVTSKDNRTNERLEELLNQNNIATFRFDFFGHGESEGDFKDVTITESVDDVVQAIAYVQQQGFSRLGLLGASFGGMASILAASKVDCLSCLALKSPVSDYFDVELQRRKPEGITQWKNEGYVTHISSKGEAKRLNYSFFEDIKNHDAYAAARKIAIPTYIIHGDADATVPVEQSRRLASVIENCHLNVLPGANHRYLLPSDFDKMITCLSDFVIKNI